MPSSNVFEFSKFDADTDRDRPRVNSRIDRNGQLYRVCKVGWCETSALLREIISGKPTKIMEPGEFPLCLNRQHTTRPGVQWLMWCMKEVPDNDPTPEEEEDNPPL